MKWSTEAVQLLNSLERYTVLKAVEEGKRLVTQVMERAQKNSHGFDVEKIHMQDAIKAVIEDLELAKLAKTGNS
jgi:polyhydroxyalkanoate synthesis regulator phasin